MLFRSGSPILYFDGYIAEAFFIDGQALTPSSFGATNASTGVWQPKAYTGTYGTNGFYLPFTDNSALTSGSNAGLGKDFSGNGNYFATNNISITSGSTYDSMTDVPTLTSATASNFATLNPTIQTLTNEPTKTITNGNLTLNVTQANGNIGCAFSTQGVTSGKYYCEYYVSNVGGANGVGFINIPINSQSAAYTLVLSDAGKAIFHPSTDANARTFTIPANSSVAFPVGTAVSFINMTSQVVSIAITTDTMYLSSAGTTGTRSLAQYG